MLIFVSLVFGILFIICGAMIAYNAYEFFQILEEFKNTPADRVFMTEYRRIQEERRGKKETS
jgi:hypothetical protein